MKRGGITHHKTLALAEKLNIPVYAAVGLLECLFHLTAAQAPRGDLGRIPDRFIARYLGWEGDVQTLTRHLLDIGWLDPHDDAQVRFLVHEWHLHADQAVQRKVQRDGTGFFVNPKKRSRKVSSHRLDMTSQRPVSVQSKTSLPEPEPVREERVPTEPSNLPTAEHLALAELLCACIREHSPQAKLPASLVGWASTFRLMQQRDGRDVEQIKQVITWATRDSFWRSNILSADKLREKWDTLVLQMQRPRTGRARVQHKDADGFVC